MMNDSMRELMDSCRPAGDDLRQPEMQPLADLIATDAEVAGQLARSQELDGAITRAMHTVPIPAGLEQRLMAALANSTVAVPDDVAALSDRDAASPEQELEMSPAADGDVVPVQPRPARGARSWRTVTALATCAAALVLISLIVYYGKPVGDVSDADLVAAALSWKLDDDSWTRGREVWTIRPLPDQIVLASVKGRQQVRLAEYGIQASCYDLEMRAGASAHLYVFAKPAGFRLPTAPPRAPMFTRGKCAAAWAAGSLAYVLVLEGGTDDYQRLIRSRSQLAVWRQQHAIPCPTRTA